MRNEMLHEQRLTHALGAALRFAASRYWKIGPGGAAGPPGATSRRCATKRIGWLAYLLEHDDATAFDPDDWLERIRDAVQTLDLVVFVPIEEADRIALAPHEDADLRRAVQDRLHDLLVDDALGSGVEVLTVSGDVRARTDQVMAQIGVKK